MYLEGEAGGSLGEISLMLSYPTFTATSTDVTVDSVSGFGEFKVEFAAPAAQVLATGTFDNVGAVASRSLGQFGLSVTRNGITCANSTGHVTLTDISYDKFGLQSFQARFEYHCAGEAAAVFGVVTHNSNVPYRIGSIGPPSDFGVVETGTEPTNSMVYVGNAGPADLHILNVTITGPNADRFGLVGGGCIGAVVTSNNHCIILVRYRPGLGEHDDVAAITVFDDDSLRDHPSEGVTFPLHGASTTSADSPYGEFHAITPARILDTRHGIGHALEPLYGGLANVVTVAGVGGVPASEVTAVVLNATAVNGGVGTFITIWPAGLRPAVSTLNPAAHQTVANMVVVPLSQEGEIHTYTDVGATDLILDVVGYYSGHDGQAGSRFHAVTPFRAVDTRDGTGGVPATAIAPGGTFAYNLNGAGGRLPATGMTAVVLNVTAVRPTGTGYLTVYPGDVVKPLASSLNFTPGATVPNLVTIRVPASGVVQFFNSNGRTHLLLDVVGYYDDVRLGNTGRFVPLAPARRWDTRSSAPLSSGATASVPFAGHDGVTAEAQAVALNITAVRPTKGGFLTVYPSDLCATPTVSNVNFSSGQTVPNMVISRLSTAGPCGPGAGSLSVFNSSGSTHSLIDIAGYFA